MSTLYNRQKYKLAFSTRIKRQLTSLPNGMRVVIEATAACITLTYDESASCVNSDNENIAGG